MDDEKTYPKACKAGIQRIVRAVGENAETAYAMMLMVSLLMDLPPEDEKVVQIILHDCGACERELA